MSGCRSSKGATFAVIGCAAALAAGVGACGGSSDPGAVSARVYVTSVCRAVGPFEREIATGAAVLDPSATSTPAQRKRMLEGYLRSVSVDAQLAVGELEAAKHPNVKRGRAIATAFLALFKRIDSGMRVAARRAARLPTGSVEAFRAADAALGRGVEGSMSDLGSSLSGLETTQLERAASRTPACQSLS